MPVPLRNLQQMALYLGVVSGGGCAMMYYLIQKSFASKEYYLAALEKLESQSKVLEMIGAPPLKVHYLRLLDKYNHVDQSTAQKTLSSIPEFQTFLQGVLHVFLCATGVGPGLRTDCTDWKKHSMIKIPVSGTILAGYLYTTAVRDSYNRRWNLQDVILKLNNGYSVPIYHSSVSGEKEEIAAENPDVL
ncbi:cytochrome c oxidase assembly factor 1 homolog isoform X1 [Pseudophryne corroboree]|uniref:cytochrome c oxidase assembly factor 1 homolog isoform X1 n=1 Tax=Pseudophryne corroboree TaxID=495146 RepID=UPI0030812939